MNLCRSQKYLKNLWQRGKSGQGFEKCWLFSPMAALNIINGTSMSVAAIYAPAKRMRNMAITATINEL